MIDAESETLMIDIYIETGEINDIEIDETDVDINMNQGRGDD